MAEDTRATEDTRAIVSYIWGTDPCQVVNALTSGASFQQASKAERVLIAYPEVKKGPHVDLLRLFWDVKGAQQDLSVDQDVVDGSSQARLRRVYNKISILKHADIIANVVLMADLDIMCTQEIDEIWSYLDGSEKTFAGVMRGAGDWPFDRPRERWTLFDSEGNLRGGVNGGVLLFRVTHALASEAERYLKEEWRPHSTWGAEQDFWSAFFSDSRIWPLPRYFNFQLHQTHLNGVTWFLA